MAESYRQLLVKNTDLAMKVHKLEQELRYYRIELPQVAKNITEAALELSKLTQCDKED